MRTSSELLSDFDKEESLPSGFTVKRGVSGGKGKTREIAKGMKEIPSRKPMGRCDLKRKCDPKAEVVEGFAHRSEG